MESRLIYHDDIRKWFELKLDHRECGQTSIQLVDFSSDSAAMDVLRGCRVKSKGAIDYSPTGYYSLDTFETVEVIEPVGSCERQLPFPDYSKAKPDTAVRQYRVDMHLDYKHGDHPIAFRISSAGKELRPWQAYANYALTGDFVLYGYCGAGFVVDKVFGTPQANPSHFDGSRSSTDAAAFDPESAALSGKRHLHLAYTCVRQP